MTTRSSKTPLIALQMTDGDVVSRCASIMGIVAQGPLPRRSSNRKPLFRAVAYGNRAAGWMMTILSFMGERRRQKILGCLAVWKTTLPHQRDREFCKRGHPLMGENLRHASYGRVCRACQALHMRGWRQDHPRPEITPDQRETKNAKARLKYQNDPTFRARQLMYCQRWKASKRARGTSATTPTGQAPRRATQLPMSRPSG